MRNALSAAFLASIVTGIIGTIAIEKKLVSMSGGMRAGLMEWIVYLIIPIGIIVLVKVVCIILTIALLNIPVSIAKMRFRSIGKVIVSSMIVSFQFCLFRNESYKKYRNY